MTDEAQIWANKVNKDWYEETLALALIFFGVSGTFAFGLMLLAGGGFFRALGAGIVVGLTSATIQARNEFAKLQSQYEKETTEKHENSQS